MREGRKKEVSKVKQTNKAKQHSTPKAVTFNELPQVGLEPTLYSRHVHVLMRDERRKEERSKHGQTNKAKQHVHVNERCRRKEESRSYIHTTKQSNTTHPRHVESKSRGCGLPWLPRR